jgi:flagellar assembly protein FliH|tara:strand:+ start:31374 stop:32222 length:849 start_codon:yes stop_codon:yes gene_type:complete
MSNPNASNSNSPTAWRRLKLHELSSQASNRAAQPANENTLKESGRARQFSPEKLNRAALRANTPAESDIPQDVLQELERISLNAREEATRKGFEQGKQQGLKEGRAAGHAEGFKAGHDEGYQDGHKEGYENGLREGQTLSGEEAQKMKMLADNLGESLSRIDQQVSDALVTLALDIARQVIRTALTARPEYIIETVQDILLTETSEQGFLCIRMHPDDIAIVRRHLKDDPRLQKWQLLSDATIEPGGCMAETSLGSIDATLQTRWSRVAGLLQENTQWLEES